MKEKYQKNILIYSHRVGLKELMDINTKD